MSVNIVVSFPPSVEQANVLPFPPFHGAGHFFGTSHKAREVNLDSLKQTARPAGQIGYCSVLNPRVLSGEDSWILASRWPHSRSDGISS